jgi:hypothetical protein
MKDWVALAPFIDKSEIKPKDKEHARRWGGYTDFAHANEEIAYTLTVLELHIIPEKEGVTISCPELELAMCGTDVVEAWQNFISAYRDLLAFLSDHEAELSEDLKRKLEIIRRPVSFRVTRED